MNRNALDIVNALCGGTCANSLLYDPSFSRCLCVFVVN
jgi:hypothetical protein